MDRKEIIKELDECIDEIHSAYKNYVEKVGIYKNKQSRLWLDTDFKEELGTGRPTVDEKKAYVNSHLEEERTARDEAYYEIEYIKYKIDSCNQKLKVSDE